MATTKKTAAKRATRKKSILTFSEHLERIKLAKQECDAVATRIPLDVRSASVALLWEIIFDTLCNSAELEISDFNTIAGIIQKLASSKVQEIPGAEINASKNSDTTPAISSEILAKIEEQLKLL